MPTSTTKCSQVTSRLKVWSSQRTMAAARLRAALPYFGASSPRMMSLSDPRRQCPLIELHGAVFLGALVEGGSDDCGLPPQLFVEGSLQRAPWAGRFYNGNYFPDPFVRVLI